MNVPLIERTKIQAEVLVPLVKTLQSDLGQEQANRLIRKALGDLYREFGRKWWQTQRTHDLGENMATAFDMFAAVDALDYEVLEKTPNAFDVNVTGCRYAKFYREIGAPELGFLLVCSSDFPMAEGFGAKVQLTRTQTMGLVAFGQAGNGVVAKPYQTLFGSARAASARRTPVAKGSVPKGPREAEGRPRLTL